MKTIHIIFFYLFAVLTGSPTQAILVTNWPFTIASQYACSDTNKIEVADDVAKLKKQIIKNIHATSADYSPNNSNRVAVVIGRNSCIGLSSSGSVTAASGVYTSRVLDGGEFNVWKGMAKVSSGFSDGAMNGFAETAPSANGVVAIYHLNSNEVDAVTQASASKIGSSQYTGEAILGANALLANGGYINTVNASLLNGGTECTICFWAKLTSYSQYGGMVNAFSGGSQPAIGFIQSGTSGLMELYADYSTRLASTLPVNSWVFIAGTIKVRDKMVVYINGVESASKSLATTGPLILSQSVPFKIGASVNYGSPGIYDEVVIYNRALSASEIFTLGQRYSVGMQLRSSNNADLSGAGVFVGPDGTSSSYYFQNRLFLYDAGTFHVADRYLQYQARLGGDGVQSPYIEAVKFIGSVGTAVDDVSGDFAQGAFGQGATNLPPRRDTPCVTLVKGPQGVVTNGAFTSRVFDAGSYVTWRNLSWDRGSELPNMLYRLEGLWHMNGDWSDEAKGHVWTGGSGYDWSEFSKLGKSSAVFNGANAYVNLGGFQTNLQSAELWINTVVPTSGILEFGAASPWLAVSNQLVIINGWSNVPPTVYVNGGVTRKLLPGWNHIAVVFPDKIVADNLTLGLARGNYFSGRMDELGVYSRALTSAEISEHFVAGRREAAGRVRFQVRADNVNPIQAPFSGNYDASPSPLAIGGQYFQYRAILEGDGTASPVLSSIAVTNSSGYFVDNEKNNFFAGTLDGATVWLHGDEMSLRPLASSGALNLMPVDSTSLLGLWHMDEVQWTLFSPTVVDELGLNKGTPYTGASVADNSAVGLRCGLFSGVGYISLSGIQLSANDFTVNAWFKTTSGNRGAVLSSYAGGAYYALEVNGDGVTTRTGLVSFVMSDGSTTVSVLGNRSDLNDGNWHHLAGVRNGLQAHLYIDGLLSGTAPIIQGFGVVDNSSQSLSIARHGNQSIYFSGNIDEVVIHGRALTEGEIGDLAALGFTTHYQGRFVSPVLDAGQPAFWENLYWGCDAPYSRPLKPDNSMAGLWHFESVSNNISTDSSGNGNDAAVMGFGISPNGRFSNGLSLAAGQSVQVNDSSLLRVSIFSAELWLNPSNAPSMTVMQKGASSPGFTIGTDALGRPILTVNGVTTTDADILRARKWNHLCGTHDGQTARLYVNGLLKGSVAVGGSVMNTSPLVMGSGLVGLLDEAVLYNRVLNSTEVLDHYRAGIGTLKFQVRSFPTSTPQGNFVGPDGSTNTWFLDFDGSTLAGNTNILINQYAQYRAVMASEDARFSPVLDSVRMDASAYPVDNPWVAPADGFGATFLGNLTTFSHLLVTTNSTVVHYQISGDNGTTWYAWFGGGWLDVTGYSSPASQWAFSNPPDVINANIGSFYNLYYQGVGGIFKFRAFLQSDSFQQVELDKVDLGYSAGRIVVLSPNGPERGDNALVLGNPLAITWSSTGQVSSANIIIELYNAANLSTPVQTVASGVTNNGRYWGALNVAGTNLLLRIRDGSDPTIEDWSDSPFEVANRPRITQPNGGEFWRLLNSNTVKWESPNPALDTTMFLWFSNDSGSNWIQVASRDNQTGTNEYLWPSPAHDWRIPSESARMGVSVPGYWSQPSDSGLNNYDISDNPFVMAGIVVTNPAGGVRLGTTNKVQWISAAAGTNVTISLTVDGGGHWTTLAQDVPNVSGANSYDCLIVAPNPADGTIIRVTSRSDTNLYGDSVPFTLADIRILSPLAGVEWQMGTTNKVSWTSGGASNLVNLSYCSDGTLTNWVPIATNVVNTNSSAGAVVTNIVPWVVAGPPSASVVVRIEAVRVPGLFANSDPFGVTGVQLLSPLGDLVPGTPLWEFAGTNSISWVKNPPGGTVQLDIAFVPPVTTNEFESLGVFNARFTPSLILPGQLRRPSTTAKVRITVVGTNMVDTSPNFFTIRGLSMVSPTNNAQVTLGTTAANVLQWYSATVGNFVNMYYAADGTNFDEQIMVNRFIGDGLNSNNWTISDRLIPTTTARVKVMTPDKQYFSISPTFTVRGIRVIQPAAGVIWDLGSMQTVSLAAAGFLNSSAKAKGEVSLTGGSAGSYVSGNLSTNIIVSRGGVTPFSWEIDPALDPSTNAVIRVSVFSPTNDADIVAVSDPFVIRGIKILSPATGTNWLVGSSHPITFLAAGLGVSDKASLYYSSDGMTFDATPITNNISVVSGLNTVGWTIESSRSPSSNAMLMVVSGTLTNFSTLFTVGGVKVTSPNSSDIWAVSDVTNTIQWVSIGVPSPFALWYTVYSNDVPIRTGAIASNGVNNAYVWTMTSNAIGDTVTISITGGGLTNESPYFSIVPAPSIRIINPVAGDFWKVSETNNVIRWKPAGGMENDFTVTYWSYAAGQQTIKTGACSLVNGFYEFAWSPIPDALGEVHIAVSNNQSTLIVDSVTNFSIAAKFNFYPLIGDVYALSKLNINWDTKGAVGSVDFFYTTDPANTNNWIPINPGNPYPIVSGEPGNFQWTVPNYQGPVWFRIQDHSYAGRRFDVSKKGPYDDLGPFVVKYYSVVWRIFDGVTSNELSGLSVVDGSGFSSSAVDSPVTFFYPAGEWNTVWSKQYFNDKVVLNWKTAAYLTNVVYMSRTEASPEYHVMANFVYDPSLNAFKTVAWLERSSKIIVAPTECNVIVYDPDGNKRGTTTSTTPQLTGVFWMDVPALSQSNRPYFAQVEIKNAGVVYASGITFTLMSPSESAVAAVNAARDAILGSVSNVNENVTGLGIAQQAFRTDVTNRLQGLSNTTATISLDVTGIQSNLMVFSSNAMAQLGGLTNSIGVIGPSGTNLLEQVRQLAQEVDRRTARILTRLTSVRAGTTFNVIYRTKPEVVPTINVAPVSGGASVFSANMLLLSGGVFERSVTASWPAGDYVISCSDASGKDFMNVKVTAFELDDLAGSMVGVSNQLARVELTLASMSVSVSNINKNVNSVTNSLAGMIVGIDSISNVIGQVAGLTNLSSSVSAMTGAVAQITVLTNMGSQLSFITNMVGPLGALTNLSPQMASVTNSMARVMAMTNQMNSLAAQMGYVTNVIDQIIILTNINPAVAAMTNAVAQIGGLTNMGSQLAFLTNAMGSVQSLTNLTPQMAFLTNITASTAAQTQYLTNLLTRMGGLTNLAPQMGYLTNAVWQLQSLTNLNVQMAYLTNVIDQVTALTNMASSVSAMTSAVAQISGLTNMGSQLAYLTNAMGSVQSLTNLSPQISFLTNVTASTALQVQNLTNAVARLQSLTNLNSQMGYLTNSVWQLQSLTNLNAQMAYVTNVIDQVTALTNMASSVSAMTSAVAQISGLTNMGAQLAYLTNAMGSVQSLTNLTPQVSSLTNLLTRMSGLTNLTPQMASLTNSMSLLVGLTNMPGQLSSMTNVISQLTGLTNISDQVAQMTNSISQIAGMTNLPSQMNYLTNVISQLTGLTNISDQVAQMTNSISQIAGMTNLPSQMNYLTNVISQLTGLTNISEQVGQMTNSISQIAGMTNLPSQMNYLTNVINKLTGLTNISEQVGQMTNSIGQIAGMTNLPSQMNYLTNVISQLSGMTNIGEQVGQMTNAISQIAGLTNLSSQMDYMTNSIAQLGALTGLVYQVAALSNALDSLSGLTNISEQIGSMTNVIGQLSGLTNISDQVSQMTNSISLIAGMTNLPSQMNYLTNVISQLTGLTNISAQVGQMTNSIGQIAGMTNLPSQMNYLTNVISQLTGLTNISAQVGQMTNSIGQIAGMTNLPSQMNYLTNVISQLSGMTNISAQVAQMTNSISLIAGMTNLPSQMNYLTNVISTLSGMTNISAQVAQMTNSIGLIAGLTNIGTQVSTLTNLNAQMAYLTNAMSALGTLSNEMAGVVTAIGQLGGLTNMGSQVAVLTNSIGQIVALTNMSGQVAGLVTGMAQLTDSTKTISNSLSSVATLDASMSSMSVTYSNMYTMIEEGLGAATDSAEANTVFGKIAAIEADVAAVGGKASAAVQRASGAKSQANSAAGAAQRIKKNMASSGQMESVMSDVGIIRKSLEDALANINAIPGEMNTGAMLTTIKSARKTMEKVAEERGIAPAVGAEPKVEPGSLSDPKAVESLINQLSETKAMMKATRQLMDEAVNKPVVVDWLEGSK